MARSIVVPAFQSLFPYFIHKHRGIVVNKIHPYGAAAERAMARSYMAHKSQKQYRLPTHNYGRAGVYFITVCVLNRVHDFGAVVDGHMVPSAIGEAAARYWNDIPTHFALVRLDQWVVMPDHFHGILVVKPNSNDLLQNQEDDTPAGLRPLRPGSVPAIINHFKGAVKRWCNQNGYPDFIWQPRYHDHIVRNAVALGNIREYIIRNPENWDPTKIDW